MCEHTKKHKNQAYKLHSKTCIFVRFGGYTDNMNIVYVRDYIIFVARISNRKHKTKKITKTVNELRRRDALRSFAKIKTNQV